MAHEYKQININKYKYKYNHRTTEPQFGSKTTFEDHIRALRNKRIGAPPPWGKAGKAGHVQPKEEKVVWRPHSKSQDLKGIQGSGEELFTRNCSDRTRGWLQTERGEI